MKRKLLTALTVFTFLIGCKNSNTSPIYKIQEGPNEISVIKLVDFLPYVVQEIKMEIESPANAMTNDSLIIWSESSEVFIENGTAQHWRKFGEVTFVLTDYNDDTEIPLKQNVTYTGELGEDFIDVTIYIHNNQNQEIEFARNDLHAFLNNYEVSWGDTYQIEIFEGGNEPIIKFATKGRFSIDDVDIEVVEQYGDSHESWQLFEFKFKIIPFNSDDKKNNISLVVDESILGDYDESAPKITKTQGGINPHNGKEYYLPQTKAFIIPFNSPHEHRNKANPSNEILSNEEETTELVVKENPKYLNYGEVRGILINNKYNEMVDILGEPNEKWQKNGVLTYLYYFKVEKFGEIGHMRITHTWGPDVIHRIDFFEPGDYIPVSPVQRVKSPV